MFEATPLLSNLKEVLVESALSPTRSISERVHSLEVKELAETFESLQTKAQTTDNEYSSPILVTPDQRLLIGPGNQGVIDYSQPWPENTVLGAVLHGRQNEIPPLSHDLLCLLADEHVTVATSSLFIINRRLVTAIFRGEETPVLDKEKLQTKASLWENNINERVNTCSYSSSEEKNQKELAAHRVLINQVIKTYKMKLFQGTFGGRILLPVELR